eukprot:GFKZ01010364.1.p1 GENE.GFKZ01010364.1~~GFKZ01010364.1.p1  ORF type:complete len:435 (-),score=63.43 GFKZ01010364.1:533-1837(-)
MNDDSDNTRKRPPLRGQISKPAPTAAPSPRSKGFSSRDQRLPASPPLLHSSTSTPTLMSAVRTKFRGALDMLFGTPPRILNDTCRLHAPRFLAPPAPAPPSASPPHTPRRPAKRTRHGDASPPTAVVADQVVPDTVWQRPCDDVDAGEVCDVESECQCVGSVWTAQGVGPEVMLRTAEELSERILGMYARAVDPNTSNVDYALLVHSPDFHRYLCTARKLRYFDPMLLRDTERKAFFLNVYNSLMIHAIAVMHKPVTMFDRISLYNAASYDIGGRAYSLNTIEHGVLRRNRPGGGPFPQRPFGENDARRLCMLEAVDPRIHFALNCGAKSCPAVRFYEAQTLDRSLDTATRVYLGDLDVDFEKRVITLPKLLQWYRTDFAEGGDVSSVIRWALPFLEGQTRENILTLLQEQEQGGDAFKVVYADYDWTVNDSSL